jgi:hypothetical protein
VRESYCDFKDSTFDAILGKFSENTFEQILKLFKITLLSLIIKSISSLKLKIINFWEKKQFFLLLIFSLKMIKC